MKSAQQVILPRKAVLELQRILGAEGTIDLAIGTNHVRAQIADIRFTSKLIDGRFPEYGRVIPAAPTKIIDAERESLRQALQRTAILSNEKYRGVRVSVKSDLMTIQAHNPEQEEAEDEVEINYQGRRMRDRVQCQLLAGCFERDRHRSRRDRTHRLQQQLPHPGAGNDEHEVRRHADAAVAIAACRWRSWRSKISAAFNGLSSPSRRASTSFRARMPPARHPSSKGFISWAAADPFAPETPSA